MALRLLLLGGIGSGKTHVAGLLQARGATVISSDAVAAEVLAPGTTATLAVLALWPDAGRDGTIKREALGRIVFSDPAELAALEAIVHPETRDAIVRAVAVVGDHPVVVEMPILRDWFDESWVRVVVDAPVETRIQRATDRTEVMTESDARSIIERQPSRAEYLLAADYVLDNSGTPEELRRQVDRLWETLETV